MVAKRKTMGSNPFSEETHPLDDLQPSSKESESSSPRRVEAKGRDGEEKISRERFTVNLPTDIITKARSTVYYTHGETLSALTERALRKEIERLERHRGEPFPEHEDRLSAGRPVRLK